MAILADFLKTFDAVAYETVLKKCTRLVSPNRTSDGSLAILPRESSLFRWMTNFQVPLRRSSVSPRVPYWGLSSSIFMSMTCQHTSMLTTQPSTRTTNLQTLSSEKTNYNMPWISFQLGQVGAIFV